MSLDEPRCSLNGGSLRRWLEEAIADSNAALPPNPAAPTNAKDTAGASVGDIHNESNSHVRKLVTVRRITTLVAINKTHQVASIDGWKVVVERAKGFVEGNLVVFLEVDSFLPAHTQFDDLFAEVGGLVSFGDHEGYRVGTSTWTDWRKSKITSQGHIYRLGHFPHIERELRALRLERSNTHNDGRFADFIRGVDFSDMLGVKKWDNGPDTTATGTTGADTGPTSNPKIPSFIRKTTIERVQNCPNLFIKPKYRRQIFQESVKMDGVSTTIYFIPSSSRHFSSLPPLPPASSHPTNTALQHAHHPNGRFGVCSRNYNLVPHHPSPPASQTLYWTAALAADLHRTLPARNQALAVQAELVGATVQGNPYGYPPGAHELLVYSVFDIAAQTRWPPREVEAFARCAGVRHVPVVGYHTVTSVAGSHGEILARAEGRAGEEGLVWKNCTDGRWFKVLSGRWILERG
ncbi:hypothetical protein BT67DRAFT_390365, partial [Trichocladium antarcticum]